ELALDGVRGVGAQVPYIDGGRAAGQPDEDDRVGAALAAADLRLRSAGLGLQLQKLRQGQAEYAGAADLQHVAAGKPFTVGGETAPTPFQGVPPNPTAND